MPLYRELWFLSGTKFSKRDEKLLKTTLVLYDQSRQHNDQNVEMVRDVITKDRHNECQGDCRTDKLITPATKMSWSDFENWSSESERTSQTTGCCATITRQLTLRFQFKNFWRRKTFPYFPHPPNSPDLAPCDFYLFSKLKFKLKGRLSGRWKT